MRFSKEKLHVNRLLKIVALCGVLLADGLAGLAPEKGETPQGPETAAAAAAAEAKPLLIFWAAPSAPAW